MQKRISESFHRVLWLGEVLLEILTRKLFVRNLTSTGSVLHRNLNDSDRAVAQAVADVAEQRGVPAPIVGATKGSHLDDAVAALSLKLTDEEVDKLEANYIPHEIAGLRPEALRKIG